MIPLIHIVSIVFGAVACLVGVILILSAPIFGDRVSDNLWAVEPVSYVATIIIISGLVIITTSYITSAFLRFSRVPNALRRNTPNR